MHGETGQLKLAKSFQHFDVSGIVSDHRDLGILGLADPSVRSLVLELHIASVLMGTRLCFDGNDGVLRESSHDENQRR